MKSNCTDAIEKGIVGNKVQKYPDPVEKSILGNEVHNALTLRRNATWEMKSKTDQGYRETKLGICRERKDGKCSS
ncbi:hypothetical protein STEG23_033269 [Scotinomys teguina]